MTKIKIAFVLSLVAIPSLVFGASNPPSNVEGVRVSNANGVVTVTWQPAKDDAGIAFYRVYYSRASILENGGDYDDFERTRGTETAFSFQKFPVKGNALYVGVLAVDTDGNESEGFETEASLVLPPVPEMATEKSDSAKPVLAQENTAPVVQEMPILMPMTYTAVIATSNTGILISFSKELDTSNPLQPESFSVKDGSGKLLAITRVDAGGSNVLLQTEPQEPTKIYTVSILSPLRAKDGSELPSSSPSVQFAGFSPPAEKVQVGVKPEPVAPTAPVERAYIKNPVIAAREVESPLSVRLVPMRQKNGLFTVLAQWRGGTNAVQGYLVSVSSDGTNFGQPKEVSAGQSSMQFENVRPGAGFSVRVVERGAGGQAERSNFASLRLPDTGVGLLGIAGAAGALALRHRMRRRKSCYD